MTIVVVGAGIAAVRFVQRLRARGATDEVVVVGAEVHQPYDRPPLSKRVLRGESELPHLVTPDALEELSVSLRLAVTATGLDAPARQLKTDAGPLDYDALVIATGAHPLRVPGLGGHVLRTWDDAARLRGEIRSGTVLAVVGAGLIGCEVAASGRSLGVEVHLIDIAEAPMARVVGPALAELVVDLHRSHGVQLHLATGVRSADAGKLTLADGTVLAPDVLLQAVGIRPATAWLAGSGLDGANGVPCDQTGATAVADVYAIGDVAAWAGHRAEHWMSATAQADRLAALFAGQDPPEPEVPYWWSDQYDVKFQGLGSIDGADDVRIRQWGPEQRPIALYGRAGRLIAAIGISAGGGVMRLRGDITAGASLNEVDSRFR